MAELGNRLPTDVRESCERMLSRSAAVPSLAYFVKYVDRMYHIKITRLT